MLKIFGKNDPYVKMTHSAARAHTINPPQITKNILPRPIYEKLLVLLNRTLLYHHRKAHLPEACHTFHYIPFWVSQLLVHNASLQQAHIKKQIDALP